MELWNWLVLFAYLLHFLNLFKVFPLKDENMKPLKQKRRSSLTKSDRTPTGPIPKKQKTRIRTLKSKLNESDLNTEEKENVIEVSVPSLGMLSPDKKPITSGKPVMAMCKDVTSRGE